MKTKLVLILTLAAAFMVLSSVATADDYERGEDDCPIRILAYVVHPVGMLAEYTITRPVHWVTKQIHLNKVFGNKDDTYQDASFKWE